MSRQVKFMQHARSVALSATGVKNFRVGCVLVDRNRVVTAGSNSYKTHPLLAQFEPKIYLHAEQDAMIRRGLDNLDGLDLYVCRVDARDKVRMARPCSNCMSLVKGSGLRNIYYSDEYWLYFKYVVKTGLVKPMGEF